MKKFILVSKMGIISERENKNWIFMKIENEKTAGFSFSHANKAKYSRANRLSHVLMYQQSVTDWNIWAAFFAKFAIHSNESIRISTKPANNDSGGGQAIAAYAVLRSRCEHPLYFCRYSLSFIHISIVQHIYYELHLYFVFS